MKLRRLFLLTVALQALLFAGVDAQIFKPIDPNKKADIGDKSVDFGETQFKVLPQPIRDQSNSPVSKDDLKLQGFETKQVDFPNLEKSTVVKPTLPQANFTAKNIAVKARDESNKNLNQSKEKAPITNRQILPFAPGGEQELKKQLNEPH
jgi:hypothetical protein